MNALAGFSPVGRGLIVAAAIAVLALFLQAAAPVIVPILLAVFIVVILIPPLRWMRKKGVPKYLGLGLVVFILLDIGSLVALIATGALEGFENRLPTYQERLTLLSQEFGRWLEGIGLENSTEAMGDFVDPTRLTPLVKGLLASAGSLFTSGLIILFTVIFLLLEAPGLPRKVRAAFQPTEETQERLVHLIQTVRKYMVIKIWTSLLTAGIVWVLLLAIGIDFAALWAILAFFLNFVPFLGPILMLIPPVLMALIQKDVGTALLVAGGFVATNAAVGSVLEPLLMGKGFGISPLVVFVSLFFWGWLFGAVGVLLSAPLTMALMTALETSGTTRPLAILFGPDIEAADEPEKEGEEAVAPAEASSA